MPEPASLFVPLGEWGEQGDGPGRLNQPTGIALDSNGFVYISDAGSGFIHKFDPFGSPRLSFQDPLLERPSAIAVDHGGAIYVTDSARNHVLIFFPDGRRLRRVTGGPAQRFQSPVGIAVNDDGDFFVVEMNGHRVQQFDSDGRFVRSWGREGEAPGEFRSPSGLAIGPDGSIYVADTGNHRVQQFTGEGEFVAAWGEPGAAPGQMEFVTSLAVSDRFVLVADRGSSCLQIWSLEGRHLVTQRFPEWTKLEVTAPVLLALGPRKEFFVLDALRSRVLRFRINF